MALFTGIAGMGTMFAVNELIKTNKMVAESTEAAVRAAESAKIQTQEAIISNLISASQKQAEYNPIIDIQSSYKFFSTNEVNKEGKLSKVNSCKISIDIVNKSSKPTWLEGLYFQVGPFFIANDISTEPLNFYYQSNKKVKSESKLVGSAHLNEGVNRKIEILLKGSKEINRSYCQDDIAKKPIFGGGLLIGSSTGVSSSLFIHASLIDYKVSNNKKVVFAPELYQLRVIGKSSRFKDENIPGYVISKNTSYYDKSIENLYPTLKELLAIHQIFIAASYDYLNDTSKSLNDHLFSRLLGTSFEFICKTKKSSCQNEFALEYDKQISEVLNMLRKNTNFKVETLHDMNNRINRLPICEEMGYGHGCKSLLETRNGFLP